MPHGSPLSATNKLINEAYELSVSDIDKRRRLIFAIGGLVKKSPSQPDLRIALGKLYADDNDYTNSLQHFCSVSKYAIAGDRLLLNNYSMLGRTLGQVDDAIYAIDRLVALLGPSEISMSTLAMALNLGALEIIKRVADGAGSVSERAQRFLSVLDEMKLLDIYDRHQKIVHLQFGKIIVDDCEFSLMLDPGDSEVREYISFEHRVYLSFEERRALQKRIITSLARLYASEGRQKFEWVGKISHSFSKVEIVEDVR